jgi:predicted ribosomally synthesized peptide with nif11-like leader
MSIENAKAFYEKVKANPSLFNQIGQTVNQNPGDAEAAIIKIAAEQKYNLTVDEMRAFFKAEAQKHSAGGELSDDELESVAGGAKGDAGWYIESIGTLGLACIGSAVAQSKDNC